MSELVIHYLECISIAVLYKVSVAGHVLLSYLQSDTGKANFRRQHLRIFRVAQSVTCLVTDASLTADPGVASSIPAGSHTFVEIDHEIISTVILLPSFESFKKDSMTVPT